MMKNDLKAIFTVVEPPKLFPHIESGTTEAACRERGIYTR